MKPSVTFSRAWDDNTLSLETLQFQISVWWRDVDLDFEKLSFLDAPIVLSLSPVFFWQYLMLKMKIAVF